VPGLLQRLLTRSGILPVLRTQWRADQTSAAKKAEAQLDKRIAALQAEIHRLEALTQRLQSLQALEPLVGFVDRIGDLDREVRVLHTTLATNIDERRHESERANVFEPGRVNAHVERAIAAAPLSTDPSVHVIVNELTPPDTYRAMLDGIPLPIFFSQRDPIKQNLKLAKLDIAPDWTLSMLDFLENVLIPKMMVPALMRKFEPHIREFYAREYGAERGPALAAVPHLATGGRLMLRRPGYHLEPHLDPKRVVFTCLLYFARPGDSAAFGTTFFRMNGTPTIDRTSTFYPGTQGISCDPVKMVPFAPNSAVAFLNWGGAHGAEIPKTAPRDTERYSYQFYVSPEPAALAALTGETEAALAD
jgi:hypothetical protein